MDELWWILLDRILRLVWRLVRVLRRDPVIKAMSAVVDEAITRTARDVAARHETRVDIGGLLRFWPHTLDVHRLTLAAGDSGDAGAALRAVVDRWVAAVDRPIGRPTGDARPLTRLARFGIDPDEVAVILDGHLRDVLSESSPPGGVLRPMYDRLLQARRFEDMTSGLSEIRDVLTARLPSTPPVGVVFALPPRQRLVGRDGDLRALHELASSHEADHPLIVVIHGMGGVGKTALAAEVARGLSDDGGRDVPFLNLDGWTPDTEDGPVPPVDPADVLRDLLAAYGIRVEDRVAGRHSALWRGAAESHGIPAVVFDNVHDEETLRDLLPSHGCVVLVTSRSRLSDLPDAHEHDLRPLTGDATATLIAGTRRRAEPAALAALVEFTGGLPLAIAAVTGALRRHRDLTMAEVAAELEKALRRSGGSPLAGSVERIEAAFALSYHRLRTDGERRAVCLLARRPGPDITVFGLSRTADISVPRAKMVLSVLESANMIEPYAGHWRFHSLFAAFAERRAAADLPAGEQDAALARLAAGYAAMLRTTGMQTSNDHDSDEAMAAATMRTWLTVERDNLVALVTELRGERRPEILGDLLDLVILAGSRFYHLGFLEHADVCFRRALTFARRRGDDVRRVDAVRRLARMAMIRGEYRRSELLFEVGRRAARRLGHPDGEAHSTWGLGEIARQRGHHTRAERLFAMARDANVTLKNRAGEAGAVRGLGRVALVRGDYAKAERYFADAKHAYEDSGDLIGTANTQRGLGHVALARGDFTLAEASFTAARETYRSIEHRIGDAHATRGLGHVAWARGRYEDANRHYRDALAICRHTGDRAGEADAIRGLGQAALACGRYAEARDLLADALRIHESIHELRSAADDLRGLGQVALGRRDLPLARRHFTAALQAHEDTGDRAGAADDMFGLGGVAAAEGDRAAAEEWWCRALDVYDEIGAWLAGRTREALHRLRSSAA